MLLDQNISTPLLDHLGSAIVATGALGTAAYGLVDATKAVRGGVSTRGFASIAQVMATLVPDKSPQAAAHTDTSEPPTPPALSLQSILITLKSNWINGMAHDDQVALAKSLVKLRMDSSLAPHLAALTGVDETVLLSLVEKISKGEALSQTETDAYSRFDLILTTLLDQSYQRADQQYRSTAKFAAGFVSVGLSVAGAIAISTDVKSAHYGVAVMIGLLATPLAPMAKDLSSAIQAGAKAVQSWRN